VQGEVERVSVGHVAGQNPGSPRQPLMGPAERLSRRTTGARGCPAVPLL
jgi:hypothetical protein